MSIYLFCEGKTEVNVVKRFAALSNPDFKGGGKDQVNASMKGVLGPKIGQSRPLRALIMRDVDQGETLQSIVQSVSGAVSTMLEERKFSVSVHLQPHQQHPNIYLLLLAEPDFRLALHLSTYRWSTSFVNSTIDDYVLDLALRESTIVTFLANKNWRTIKPVQVERKITERIPVLLQENGIPLQEAKDYVRLYAAVLQEHTSPATFADKTLANANEAEKQAVFAPLLAALNFLGDASQ
jgi:hypothetical protein